MTSTVLTCDKADCTVGLTGRCLESVPDPASCPNAQPRPASPAPSAPEASVRVARRFHPGHELGLGDALAITRARYTHLVAVLGASNAGKTCFLTSLYLHACHGLLAPDYRFAGSLTLQGFELRARGLRSWRAGALPEQLVEHTALADPRYPAFMHLALDRPNDPRGRAELLLSDLPGEWTSQLVNRADRAARFDFLARADCVAFVVEGPSLANNATRHQELANARQLFGRLKNDVRLPPDTPLLLLVSKMDELDGALPATVGRVEEAAQQLGFSPQTVPTASFSRRPDRVPNGSGVVEALRAMLAPAPRGAVPASIAAAQPAGARSFLRRAQTEVPNV
ncbi:MAG: hypothetical protein U0797_08015 [Gemmataceae bacterium]